MSFRIFTILLSSLFDLKFSEHKNLFSSLQLYSITLQSILCKSILKLSFCVHSEEKFPIFSSFSFIKALQSSHTINRLFGSFNINIGLFLQ